MLGLSLREEFRGASLRGTAIDFTNEAKTGALDQKPSDFLRITYPSVDLLKTLKAAAVSSSGSAVLIGDRGQGKSHLMAALYHLLSDPGAGELWLRDWADRLGRPELGRLAIRGARYVIAEPLHERRYTHLWDLLFARHPNGEQARVAWTERRTEVPGKDLLVGMFRQTPCAVLLDEFQTWFDGLSNSTEPRQHWAFNFIQILTEIARDQPELLTLVVSVREARSSAARQLLRVSPVSVDFKGEPSQQDRQRLVLHRIFENRTDIATAQIASLLQTHLSEFMRLRQIAGSEFEKYQRRFLEAWPYSPDLLQLLDDEVMNAIEAQGTRDRVRILVELFKVVGERVPLITPADFGHIASTLIDDQTQLRDRALRNVTAVEDALGGDASRVPHLREMLASVWLRSLSSDPQRAGADPETVQLDVMRSSRIDDNAFRSELATIEANSYNLHRVGARLVLKLDENPRTRLMAHARSNRLFQNGEDADFLAAQIRQVFDGQAQAGNPHRTIVLGRNWVESPWDEPPRSGGKIPLIVLPEHPDNLHATLGGWLKQHLRTDRNTVRFLLPRRGADGASNIYLDEELMLAARAATLARDWSRTEPAYKSLSRELTGALQKKLADRFDRFAILSVWNHGDPAKCQFSIEPHGAQGQHIPAAIQDKIKQDLFADEEFDELVADFTRKSLSVAKLIAELREPRGAGLRCIPWLGEAEVEDRLRAAYASQDLGADMPAAQDLGAGIPQGRRKHAAGQIELAGPDIPPVDPAAPRIPITTRLSSEATSGLNLLSRVVDVWGIKPSTTLRNASVRIDKLSGAQLKQLIRELPDGPSYGLEADREDP
jgi:hypothetical protein